MLQIVRITNGGFDLETGEDIGPAIVLRNSRTGVEREISVAPSFLQEMAAVFSGNAAPVEEELDDDDSDFEEQDPPDEYREDELFNEKRGAMSI